jgi:hypothetical protein
MTTDLARSNSLTDLAARIKIEHEAACGALKQGLEHAVAAGKLLLEAKAQVPHGQWLPWLGEHCASVSARTAQAYMRVARSFDNLGAVSAQRVADLSFREALQSLATAGSVAKALPPESQERALSRVESDQERTLVQAVQRVRIEDKRAQVCNWETPEALLPTAAGRRIRTARNASLRQWMLIIGPSSSSAPVIETFDFQCDETTDAKLASMPQEELVNTLLAARGKRRDGLAEIERGYWGDMKDSLKHAVPGPGGTWTRVGSPEWLNELFGHGRPGRAA